MSQKAKRERILVTSALPYANGPIHFGHIVGAYLPADIFVRYGRMKGREIFFVCGTDEHGVAITLSARQAGIPLPEYVQHWHQVIRTTFERMNIRFDHFSRTTIPRHRELTQQFFTTMLEKDLIHDKTEKQPYCNTCQHFLPDRYLVGTCPYCGAEGARGDECPRCGKWLDPELLRDIRCKTCGSIPVEKETRHWYMRLDVLQPRVEEWHRKHNQDWKPNVRSFVQKMLKEGLRDRPITRDLDWGVPVPLPEARGKVIYVWFDAPIGYISATMEWAELQGEPDRWKDYWLDPDCRLYHFIGKDNIPFHCVLFPAMLMSQDEKYILPTNVPANEFFNLEGGKFSTSEGWFIDLDDFFSKYTTDSLRYALTSNQPETGDSEFTWKGFQAYNNNELADTLGNFAARVLKFIDQYQEGIVPELREKDQVSGDRTILEAAERCPELAGEQIETFHQRKALEEVMGLARAANKYFDEMEPWVTRKTDPDRCRTTLAVGARLLRTLAVVLSPFLPDSAERLWLMLGLPGEAADQPWDEAGSTPLPEATRIRRPEVLFVKIEDDVIAAEIQALEERAKMARDARPESADGEPESPAPAAATPSHGSLPELKPPVKIDDFARMDLRVGTILSAEPVEGTDKLLRLEIDIGVEKRQVVSGIREQYSPEEVLGTQVILFANLEPRKIRGTLSQGMILAADHEGIPILLTPNRQGVNGSIVR